MSQQTQRPKGLGTIGILRVIGGIVGCGLGLLYATNHSAYLGFMGETVADYESEAELAFVAAFVGGIILLVGAVNIIVGFATYRGKQWTWKGNLMLSVILIALSVIDLTLGEVQGVIPSIFFNVFVIFWLFRTDVKEYFGRVKTLGTDAEAYHLL